MQYVIFFCLVHLRFVSDGTVAIFMSMLFFVVPSQLPKFRGYGYDDAGDIFYFNASAENKSLSLAHDDTLAQEYLVDMLLFQTN